ncbi:MAG: DEAD/DEAH box helicase [Bryobacteraceae bacterium]
MLAHSARPERGVPPQGFWEHIERVTCAAVDSAGRASAFWTGDRDLFCAEVEAAARLHDCGKLAPENQAVLARISRDRLPVRHEDAGAAWLLEDRRKKAALLVASHHAGLPARSAEQKKAFAKPQGAPYRITEALDHTERHMAQYRAEYEKANCLLDRSPARSDDWSGLAHRFALSCLVDADHSDTAAHYRQAVPAKAAKPRWAERIEALDRYVGDLSANHKEDPRSQDRQAVYENCCHAEPGGSIVSCDAAVGSGKTTAVMGYLLRVVEREKLRHILVVLPFTNIIQQSVDVYRQALVLPGEKPDEVVAEVHHRAEFQNPDLREMSVLWDAPITVTTAVQFFETLAASKPARLRKLHELPGSAVFIDEAHASIPISLWPLSWLWLKELTSDWGCHFVLGSGSLAKFWENRDFMQAPETIPELLEPRIRARLAAVEERRVQIRTHLETLGCDALADFVAGTIGPRLVILNTVQSAAVLADRMRKRGLDVMHLSTALAPADRERVLERVRGRLTAVGRTDWTLVATSCVEAGVDFSFRTAIRESCSAASLIQTGGRVNRHGSWSAADVWDVRLLDAMFNQHPGFKYSREVLQGMLAAGELAGDISGMVTEALRRELVLKDVRSKADRLRDCEAQEEWPEVALLYRVIDSDTQTVVVDPELVRRIEEGEQVPWRELVRGSVQMWKKKVQDLALRRLDRDGELFCWTGRYDGDFLGYMDGVLPLLKGRDSGLFA